jgi:hypothetical protein
LSYNGKRYRAWRAKLLAQYGPMCVGCGNTDTWALTLDHVNGGGNEHRNRRGHTISVYIDACRENDRTKYQILCWNCNLAKH